MYESRFGISGLPFQLSPDPSFYFDSRCHHRALAMLRRGLAEDSGVIVVSGDVGAGKTTLVRTLLGELDPAVLAVAHVVSTQLNAEELLSAALIGFGIPPEGASQGELVSKLLHLLDKLDAQARRAVLIVDEAQNLHRDALDQLVRIAALKSTRRLPLQVCLVGQPELNAVLEADEMRPLRELVSASCHLGPIERDEAGAYIEHRLRCVGWSGSPSFDPDAFAEVFRWTAGVPRRINLLCNRLMLSCFLSGGATIDAATVGKTARDLRAEIGEPSLEAGELTEMPVRAMAGSEPLAPMERGTLLCVAADISDHIKSAALIRAFADRQTQLRTRLVRVHNNDALELSRPLFDGLDVDTLVIHLGIPEDGEGTPSELMKAFQRVVSQVVPCAVIVFDGSEVALACGSVASSNDTPVIHVGAGLRVGNPDEAGQGTRKPTDDLADLLYTTDAQASEALAAEGVAAERVHCVGNLLVDALKMALRTPTGAAMKGAGSAVAKPYLANRNGYGLVVIQQTLNLGSNESLLESLSVLCDVSRDLQLVWPMQSHTEAQLHRSGLRAMLSNRILCLPAQPYLDYVVLLRNATCVLTDSWSVQEEATALSVPCITLGLHPERSITVNVGSNVPVGNSCTLAVRAVWECVFNGGKRGRVPELWDGKAGARIASYLCAWLPSNTDDQHVAVTSS